MINGRTGDGEAYRRTSRYTRRQSRKKSDAITLPSVLGPVTNVAAALANGALRRTNLQTRFEERVLQSVRKVDAAGLVVEWKLPNVKPGPGIRIGKGRARRGIALALNSAFPLALHVRKLAKELAAEFGLAIESDMSAAERALAPVCASFDLDRLCGSAISTHMLMTLASFRGSVATSMLYRCVPGHSAGSAKVVAERLKRLGVLVVAEGTISFSKASWMPAFQRLLRAAVVLKPGFAVDVKRLSREKTDRAKTQRRFQLFGKSATERALFILARKGVVSRTELNAEAHLFADHSILIRLRRMGLIVHETVNHQTQISLNEAHPLFKPLRRFLLAVEGTTALAKRCAFLKDEDRAFSADELFGSKLRLNVLIMMYLAGDDGIDGSDLRRLLPQHTIRNLVDSMWDFCALNIALEEPMDFGMIRYRLNPQYPQIRTLRSLLKSLSELYPMYSRILKMREHLWPERRATREWNRAADKIKRADF